MDSCSSGSGLSKLQSKVLDSHRAHHQSSSQAPQLRPAGNMNTFLSPGSTRPGVELPLLLHQPPLSFLSSRAESRQDNGLVKEFSSFRQQGQESIGSIPANNPTINQLSLIRRPFLPVYNRSSGSNFNPTIQNQDAIVRNDNQEWDKEFNKLSLAEDASTLNTFIEVDTDKEALASSADHLINVMETTSSEKFQNSQFLKFLHRVSDTTKKEISQTSSVQVNSNPLITVFFFP
jgi:hypothetical protein